MKADLTFAVVGYGKIGSRHSAHVHRLAKLVAVCDLHADKREEAANEYHVNTYADIETLLAEIKPDVVSVCTPNGLHAKHTIAALRAGCHVVCEKPMAISYADCMKMITAAEEACKSLFIVKQNRFNDAVVQVKNLLKQNALGIIYSFQVNGFWNRNNDYYRHSWHGKKDMDGGTLFTQFSHFIDVMYWLLGDVAFVQSYLRNAAHGTLIETEDTGCAILQMQSGAIGTLHYTVNSYAKNMEGSLTLFGERGTIKIGGEYLNIISYQSIDGIAIQDIQQSPPNDYGTYKGSMSNHDKVYENVIDVLCNHGIISTRAEEGAKTVEIIEKIYAANKNQ